MKATRRKNQQRDRRKLSTRRRITVHATRPRLCVHRSVKHIYAQIVDAETGRTLCGIGTTARSLGGDLEGKNKTQRAAVIGREIARRAKEAGVQAVVHDRGASKYHGRVKALAEAAREEGLQF